METSVRDETGERSHAAETVAFDPATMGAPPAWTRLRDGPAPRTDLPPANRRGTPDAPTQEFQVSTGTTSGENRVEAVEEIDTPIELPEPVDEMPAAPAVPTPPTPSAPPAPPPLPATHQVRREVTEEVRMVAVDVAHETLRVEQRPLTPRLATPRERQRAFVEDTVHIPVFGQLPRAAKRAVVTGEVTVPHEGGFLLPREVPREHDLSPAATPEAIPEDALISETALDETRAVEVAGVSVAADSMVADDLDDDTGAGSDAETHTQSRAANPPAWRRVIGDIRQGWSRARTREAPDPTEGP